MLFAQGLGMSPVNYGLFFFSFALLLGTFHGYRVPHKVFYGLAMLATCIYGIVQIIEHNDYGTSLAHQSQVYIFILQFLRAFGFYISYGLLEKYSNKYQN